MRTRILRATAVAGMVALKLQTVYQRFLNALDAFAEAKMRNAVQERELRREQREMNRCRRLVHAGHGSAVKTVQNGQLHKSAPSSPKQEKDLIRAEAEIAIIDDRTITLALSESRTYDSALEIRGAYKLTATFMSTSKSSLSILAPSTTSRLKSSPNPG